MKSISNVLVKPLITEKSSLFLAEKKYFFKVRANANKIEIRNAVESIFKVKVAKVNTLNVSGKAKQYGKHKGSTQDWKKAIVTLADGKIDFGQVEKDK